MDGYKNINFGYCLSMVIPGDTIYIKINDKDLYKFYFDCSNFIKMNYLIDRGHWETKYIRKEHDWEEKWIHDYHTEYLYPEHVLQFVGYDLINFLQKGRYLVHVSHIYDLDMETRYYNYSHSKGHYKSCNIGMHDSFATCGRGNRTFNNILINETITLKPVDQPIIAFSEKNPFFI